MMTLSDPKLRMALQNDSAARSLLSELHQQILGRPQPSVLSQLLAKYVTTAAALSASDSATRLQDGLQKQRALVQMLSNIAKNQHDAAQAIIQNLRA